MRQFLILGLTLSASCASYHMPDRQPSIFIAVGDPRVAYGDYVGLANGSRGTLSVKFGCVVFSGRSVIWRKGTRFDTDQNAFVVPSGASYPFGKRVNMMGTTVSTIDHLIVTWDQPNPCPGPWLIAS